MHFEWYPAVYLAKAINADRYIYRKKKRAFFLLANTIRLNEQMLSRYWVWEENTSIEMEIMKTKIFFSDSGFERFLERDTG